MLTLSRLTSLRFAFDPAGFLTAGRAAAARSSSSAWAFYLPTARRMLGERVTALSTRKHAEAVLSPGVSVMLDGEVLAPLLGRTSSLLDLPGAAAPPRVDVPAPSSVRMAIVGAIESSSSWGRRFDLVAALELAAVRIACRTIDPEAGRTNDAAEVARELLAAADTPALVCPPLRLFSCRWRRLAQARRDFLAALEVPSDERDEDRAVTLLVGSVDAPVVLACAAMIVQSSVTMAPSTAVNAALRVPPVPMLLRRLVRPVDIEGVGVLREGEAVAVDAGASGLPFGFGPHACVGARLGRMFAEEAVAVCDRLGVRVVPQRVRWGRRRLVVAPARLVCERGT